MSEDGGNRIESKKVVDILLPDGSLGSVKTVEISNNATPKKIFSRHISKFDANYRLIASSDGDDSDPVTTEYHYPADPLGQIEWMKRSDGYFEKYGYEGDRAVLPYTKIVIRPWLDQAFETATAGNSRTTETLTETISGGTRVTVTEKIAGNIVSKSIESSATQLPGIAGAGSALYGNIGDQLVHVAASQRFARDASGALVGGGVSTRISFATGADFKLAGRLIKETNEEGIGVSVRYNSARKTGSGTNGIKLSGLLDG